MRAIGAGAGHLMQCRIEALAHLGTSSRLQKSLRQLYARQAQQSRRQPAAGSPLHLLVQGGRQRRPSGGIKQRQLPPQLMKLQAQLPAGERVAGQAQRRAGCQQSAPCVCAGQGSYSTSARSRALSRPVALTHLQMMADGSERSPFSTSASVPVMMLAPAWGSGGGVGGSLVHGQLKPRQQAQCSGSNTASGSDLAGTAKQGAHPGRLAW